MNKKHYKIAKILVILIILGLTYYYSRPLFRLYNEYGQSFVINIPLSTSSNNLYANPNYTLIANKDYRPSFDDYRMGEYNRLIQKYYSDQHYRQLNMEAAQANDKLENIFIAFMFIILIDFAVFGLPDNIKRLIQSLGE